MLQKPSHESEPTVWRMPRIYTDESGESRWGEVAFPLKPGKLGSVSERIPCDGVYLRYTPGTFVSEPHVAPRRQIVVGLNSLTEVTTSTNSSLRFGSGDCMQVALTASIRLPPWLTATSLQLAPSPTFSKVRLRPKVRPKVHT